MKVILRQDHDKLGEAGKVIQVKAGFARNFLIPKGIVYPATSENMKKYDRDKEQLNIVNLKNWLKFWKMFHVLLLFKSVKKTNCLVLLLLKILQKY